MRLAIIGAGNVGATLGRAFTQAGREIVFGVRDPSSQRVQEALASLGGSHRALPVAEAVADAEVVLLATPWSGAQDAIAAAGDFGGRVLVDCTNPLGPDLSLALGHRTSGGEQLATWASGARVVKSFNTTGFSNMANPRYPEGAATMFICGDDTAARRTVQELGAAIGFDVVDCGPLRQARVLEPLAALWISLALGGMGQDIAFRLMRR